MFCVDRDDSVVMAPLSTIAPNHKSPKWQSAVGWINKLWFTHMPEYNTAIKKNEPLQGAQAQMSLPDMMASEMSQVQESTYYRVQFI